MRNKMGCFQLKFKEPKVVGSDDDFETMKVNASKQWDSKVGTIIVEWRLYKKGAFLYSSKTTNEPPRHESVGNTKKFWERPSASVELGQEFPSPNGGIFHHYVKTYIAGAHYTGKSTVWYHHPSVVDVLRIKSENGGAYVSPAPNTPHRRSAKRKAPVFLVDLTDIDETTGSGSSSTGCNSGNSSGSSSGSSSKGKVIDLMNDDDDGKCEVLDLTVAAKRAHQKSEFMRFLGNEFI